MYQAIRSGCVPVVLVARKQETLETIALKDIIDWEAIVIFVDTGATMKDSIQNLLSSLRAVGEEEWSLRRSGVGILAEVFTYHESVKPFDAVANR